MALDAISKVSSANVYGTTEVKQAASVNQVTAPVNQAAPVNQVAAPAYSNFDSQQKEDDEPYSGGNAPSENTVKQAISDINKKINPNTIAQYGFHEETNRVTIKIVDKESDKVIKEFPAEETLDMIAKVWELAGMFLDEKG